MTISTPRINSRGSRAGALGCRRHGERGFTLVEVIVAATISSFILAGILSAFLMITRTGFAAGAYSELETETRRALEIFGEDARKTKDIHWNTAQSVTLYVATSSTATVQVTYAYDGTRGSATYGCFYRMLGDANSTLPRRALVHNVNADFSFQRFKLEQPGVTDNSAATDLETKQLQVTLRASRSANTAVTANQAALSARYVLRNKRVSN
jgi:prepilin-type N-terminal cleavage/methylation domain-containing protein